MTGTAKKLPFDELIKQGFLGNRVPKLPFNGYADETALQADMPVSTKFTYETAAGAVKTVAKKANGTIVTATFA